MKRVLIALLLSFTAPVFAEPALVKSGEHSGFSRLVLYTGGAHSWQKTRAANTVSIEVSGWDAGFDISDVFEMIPRDRITNLQADDSSLKLALSCDCTVTIEPLDHVGLVVDVSDASPLASIPLPKVEPKLTNWPTAEQMSAHSKTIEAMRKTMSKRIAKAATQNILNVIPLAGGENSQSANQPKRPAPTAASELRMRTSSALERAARRLSATDVPPISCPPERFGAIENWGSDAPFSEQLGKIRSSLLGEFDTLDTSKAIQLSRLYIYFAMGSEALSSIQAFKQTGPEMQFLQPLAKLVDGRDTTESRLDIPLNGCTGTLAIWAALLAREKGQVSEPQAKVVVENFNRLPHHLKTILGPGLIARLSADGNLIAASVVRNSISNYFGDVPDDAPDHPDLNELNKADLEALIAKGNKNSPPAILALLDFKIGTKSPASDALRDVAESFVIQQRGDPISQQIQSRLAKDAAIRHQYSDSLARALQQSDKIIRRNLVSYAAKQVVADGSDAEVAKFSLLLKNSSAVEYLDKATTLNMAARLRDIGLTDLANSLSRKPAKSFREKTEVTRKPATKSRSRAPAAIEAPPATLSGAQSVLGQSAEVRNKVLSLLDP